MILVRLEGWKAGRLGSAQVGGLALKNIARQIEQLEPEDELTPRSWILLFFDQLKRRVAMFKKRAFLMVSSLVVVIDLLLFACATPIPEVAERIVPPGSEETVIVLGTPRIVEKETPVKVVEVAEEQGQWKQLNGPQGCPIADLAIDPTAPQIVYMTIDGGGVYKSTDGGESWFDIGTDDLFDAWSIAIDPANSQTLYVGTWTRGIFKSVDGGKTWQEITGDMPVHTAFDIVISPADPEWPPHYSA